jgi:serine/threonine protein kinase
LLGLNADILVKEGQGMEGNVSTHNAPPVSAAKVCAGLQPRRGQLINGMRVLNTLGTRSENAVVVAVRLTPSIWRKVRACVEHQSRRTFAAKFDLSDHGLLRREQELLARARHPHVLATSSVFVEHRGPSLCGRMYRFFVMPRFHTDAHDMLNNLKRPMKKTKRLALCRQTGEGLLAMHAVGIVHGDIKLENLLVHKTADGGFHVCVADLGSAYDLWSDEPHSDNAHTINFSAPEVICNVEITPAVDVFSLGCVYAELALYQSFFFLTDEELEEDRKDVELLHLHHTKVLNSTQSFHPTVAADRDYFQEDKTLRPVDLGDRPHTTPDGVLKRWTDAGVAHWDRSLVHHACSLDHRARPTMAALVHSFTAKETGAEAKKASGREKGAQRTQEIRKTQEAHSKPATPTSPATVAVLVAPEQTS